MSISNNRLVQDSDSHQILQSILEGTAAHTGKSFFRQLVKHLALTLETDAAWITELQNDAMTLKALAFWIDGKFVEDFEYQVKGTPCEVVLGKNELLHIPRHVIDLFPEDDDLRMQQAMSYLGAPLLDQYGNILGNLAVMDREEMPEEYHNLTLFKIFADRGASELSRVKAELQLREREEQLSRLFNSAMDAIVEIDSGLNIIQANRAARQLFEYQDCGGMVGQSFEKFLIPDSTVKLRNMVTSLRNRPKGRRYLWVPGGFKAVNHNKETFHFEATLSCYKHEGKQYFNLVLRDVTDRIEAEKRIDILSHEAEYLRQEIKEIHNTDEIIGESIAMQSLKEEIAQVAGTEATVLISGETGTGKELVARAIHANSKRKDKPLIKVNCAAIPETLIESEFFGHEKGAYTGATEQRKGRFAIADGGTIFLDEIGDLPFQLQSKLLRVLQEGEFEPVGSSQTRKVDCRVIAASNRDLKKMMREGEFRADLYYRLNVFPIEIPPLRERGGDIKLLAQTFAERYSQLAGRSIQSLSEEEIACLNSYHWPGNVRELQNIMERAIITARGGKLNLPALISGSDTCSEILPFEADNKVMTAEELQQQERQNMIRALEATGWKVAGDNGAARLLDIPPSTFSSRMKALEIERPS